MRLWDEARVAVYSALQRSLPAAMRDWIGGSSLTARLRRALLWDLVQSEVSFHGYQFTISAPIKMIATIRRDGGIENGLCRLVLEQCRLGDVAIDVGANYGFVSLVMTQAVGPKGQVHSFEVDPEIVRALMANVTANGVGDRCRVVQTFVGNIADGQGRTTIDAYTEAVGLERLDFLKIDVDGPDLAVLEGAQKTLARFQPVVAIEMSGEQQRIISLLQELGYECTDMKGREIDPNAWPPNILAAVGRRLQVPPRSASLPR